MLMHNINIEVKEGEREGDRGHFIPFFLISHLHILLIVHEFIFINNSITFFLIKH